jgi:hypothetical protein
MMMAQPRRSSSNNYHWYLKQTISCHGRRIKSFAWDEEQSLCLHLLTDTSFEQAEFVWDVSSREHSTLLQSTAVTAVIDGPKLLLTLLHRALILPPMASHALVFGFNVNSIIFDADRERLAVLLPMVTS